MDGRAPSLHSGCQSSCYRPFWCNETVAQGRQQRGQAAGRTTHLWHQRDPAGKPRVGAQSVAQRHEVDVHGLKGQHPETVGGRRHGVAAQVGADVQQGHLGPRQAPLLRGG